MTHKIDDVLKHYGVKGMKWKNRKDPEEVDGKQEELNKDSEVPDFATFMVKEFFKDVGKKISQIDDVIKKRGEKLLTSIFGKSKKTITINGKTPKQLAAIQKVRNKRVINPAGSELDRIKKMSPADKKKIRDKWKNVPDAKRSGWNI